MEKKVVLVTGAGTGIGKGCAASFLAAGYRVVLAGRRMEKLKEAVEELDSEDVICFSADVSKQEEVKELMDAIIEKFGRLDVAVNNAGICNSHPFLDITAEQYDSVVRVNQYGTFFCMQEAARRMAARKIKGVLINMSSVFSEMASPGIIAYHASKGAISMMTKSAALELAPYGIRVVGIAPGVIETPMLDIDKERGTWDSIQQKHLRKKALQPAAVGETAVFLASDQAAGINGCIVPVDDGFLAFK